MDRARFADRHAHGVIDVRHGDDALEAMSKGGFWAVVATFERAVTAIRFAVVEPVVAGGGDGAGGSPTVDAARRRLDHLTRRDGIRLGGGGGARADRCGLRLPGQRLPCPPARAQRRRRSRRAGSVGGTRQSGASRVAHPVRCRRHRPRVRVTGALPPAWGRPARHASHQGHRAHARADAAQGPRRERHDRRPHAQRPLRGLRARHRVGRRAVRHRGAPRARAPRLHRERPAADGSRVARDLRRDLPARVGVGGAQVERPDRRSATSSRWRAAPTAAPSAGSTATPARPSSPSASAPSGPTATSTDVRRLSFGTGAGITWHSDPEGEWRETELKAARLIGLAAGTVTP